MSSPLAIVLITYDLAVIFMLGRALLAYRFRMKLINGVSRAASIDIIMAREWMWRYDRLGEVSPWELLWPFWISFKTAYGGNLDFAEVSGRP